MKDFGSLPDWLLAFESSYNRETGGWGPGGFDYGSVELEVGRLWHSLVLLHRPMLVLETGSYKGYSAACIAAGLDSLGGGRKVYTIDCNPHPQIWRGTELERFIQLIVSKSKDAVGMFGSVMFDMLVLDSDHSYDTLISELALYEPKLSVGGLILLHDSVYFDGVGAALRQLAGLGRFECVTLDSPRHHHTKTERSPGVSIVRKMAEGDAVVFDPRFSGWDVGDHSKPPFIRQKLQIA